MTWVLRDGDWLFKTKTLTVSVFHIPGRQGWFVTCEEARLDRVALIDPESEQACNEAIGMVADRLGWLARGWLRDLKGVKSLILDELDPTRGTR